MKNYKIKENYVVYNDGTIFSLQSKMFMNSINTNGYLSVKMAGKLESIHRLVGGLFIPNPDNKPEINHIDGDKTNNKVENLEWVSPSENIQHKIHQLGKEHRGSKNGMAKLTLEDVDKIKVLYQSGYSQNKLGKMFGISQGKISNVVNEKSYKV
jgi:hypothetical protein